MGIKELREKRGQLYHQMKDIAKEAREGNRTFTPEERQKLDKAEIDMKALDGDIRRLEDMAKRSAAHSEQREIKPQPKEDLGEQRKAAFNKFLRSGRNSLTSQERQILQQRGTATQVQGTDTLGGFIVPKEFGGVDVATQFVGDLEGLAFHIDTDTGGDLELPTVDDTATKATQTAEGAAVAVQDLAIGQQILKSYSYDTMIKVSTKLLQNQDINLVALIQELAAERIRKATNEAFTVGVGTTAPAGIVTGSTLGKTAASATAITAQELLDLYYSVDNSYRSAAVYMANDSTHSVIRGLALTAKKDAPVVTVDGMGNIRINGKMLHINNDMASIATGAKSVLFGDVKKFAVRRIRGTKVLRLNERFMDEKKVGFMVWRDVDSIVRNGSAIKHLIQA